MMGGRCNGEAGRLSGAGAGGRALLALLRAMTVGVAVLLFAGCGSPEPVTLGFISGQTGPFSDLGQAGLKGAVFAVEERNRAGGVAGRPVRLLIRDDEHSASRAKAAFAELVAQHVTAIVGPMTSSMAMVLVPLADEAGVVLMGGTVVTNELTGKDDYFFRAIGATRYYATYSARVHLQALGPKRIVVIYDAANRDYAEDWARDYVAEIGRQGNTGTEIVQIDSRTLVDPMALVRTVLKSQPDLVTCACSARSAALLMRDIRAQNPAVHFATSAWAADRLLIEQGGPAAEGAIVEQYHNVADRSEHYLRFVSDYQRRFDEEPNYASIVAYDATKVVLDALEEDPRGLHLKNVLLNKGVFSGLQSGILLNAEGDASRQAFSTRIQGGRFVPLP